MNQVAFYSRAKIVNTPGEPTTALISISCPNDPAPLKEGWGALLRLEFDDMGATPVPEIKDLRTGTVRRFVSFTKEQAQTLIDFIDGLPSGITRVYVHCDAGISRSAAVARFVSQKLGCLLVGDDRFANAHVLATLHKVNRSWSQMFGGELNMSESESER